MNAKDLVRWKTVLTHLEAAYFEAAQLDATTQGQQQFIACVVASEIDRMRVNLSRMLTRVSPQEPRPSPVKPFHSMPVAATYTCCGKAICVLWTDNGAAIQCPTCGRVLNNRTNGH